MKLHKNATTSLEVRQMIRDSNLPMVVLARQLGVTVETVARWKHRSSVEDRPHTRHNLSATLCPGQDAVLLAVRMALGLSLDDLLTVARTFVHPSVSRTTLHRMLKRHGTPASAGGLPMRKRRRLREADLPGFVKVWDWRLPRMRADDSAPYLFAAVDRATRWLYAALYPTKTATHTRRFLTALRSNAPFHIETVQLGDGNEYPGHITTPPEKLAWHMERDIRQFCGDFDVTSTSRHAALRKEESAAGYFDGDLGDLLRGGHIGPDQALKSVLLRCVTLYNHQTPLRALGNKSPSQALKDCWVLRPERFRKRAEKLLAEPPDRDCTP